MFKHYSFKQKLSSIFTMVAYVLFALMVIYAGMYAGGDYRSILFVILGIASLIFGGLNEYLKHLYNEALWHLNFKIDTKKACEVYDKLSKYDLFGMYKRNRGLFDTMVAIEEKDGNRALKIIEENSKKYNSNVELLLIRRYYEMRAYMLIGKEKKVNEAYNDVKNIEKMKKRPKIFQYDELDGLAERAKKNRSLAYDHFAKVNMTNMNPKEMKFILENLIITAPDSKKDEYKADLEKLMEAVSES